MPTTIRMATEADAPAVQAIYAPFCEADSHVSFEYEPPSVEAMGERIRRVVGAFPWLVADRDGTVLGYAYAGPHAERVGYRWAVNAGIYLADGHRGEGLGKALYTALFAILRAQGHVNVYAGIAEPNPPSVALHEATGFRRVAFYPGIGYKAGAWLDVGWYHLALRDPGPGVPEPPLGVADVEGTAAWRDAIAAGEALIRG